MNFCSLDAQQRPVVVDLQRKDLLLGSGGTSGIPLLLFRVPRHANDAVEPAAKYEVNNVAYKTALIS